MWCEGVSNEGANKGHSGSKRKRDDSGVSKRQEKEEDVDDNFKVLQEKHGKDKQFTTPLLRLWARTISAGLHDDLDSPPDLPAFAQPQPKKPRKQESLSDTISEAAVSIVHALSGSSKEKGKEQDNPTKSASVSLGVSPGKSVELRMKNFEQLRYLQQLYEDHILDEDEYKEQKQKILTSLRKL